MLTASSLPDYVIKYAGIKTFSQTATCLSDSTVLEFRVECILKLRDLGYDTKRWHCKGGAYETQFAVDILLSPSVDLSIVFPNGVRLSKQQDCREPYWLEPCCAQMATALHMTSAKAVAFVGDASLSPGLEHAAVRG